MQSTGMVRPLAKKRLQTPVDWDTHTHAHPAHTGVGYANAGILAAGALLCAGAAAARRRRPRAWHARNFQSILIGTPSISSGNG